MIRRDFIRSAAVTATVLLLPTREMAVKSTPAIDFATLNDFELVERTFVLLDKLQFSQREQAMALGFLPHAPYLGATREGLRELTLRYAIEYPQEALWERIALLHEIRDRLNDLFAAYNVTEAPTTHLINTWASDATGRAHGRSIRELMTGDLVDIRLAAESLRVAREILSG